MFSKVSRNDTESFLRKPDDVAQAMKKFARDCLKLNVGLPQRNSAGLLNVSLSTFGQIV